MTYSELVAIFSAVRRRCCGSLLLTLCVLTVNAWLLPAVVAQPAPPAADQTASHRRLPLPSHGTPDLQQQMFLMKQLKALMSGQSATPPPKSAEGHPEQNHVQDALKALKDRLPPELRPMLDNVPPALVEQAMSDPAIKEQMKQVLEQYSKSRQIPQGNSQNGSRLPLPPSGPKSSDLSSGKSANSTPSQPETPRRSDSSNAPNGSSEPQPSSGDESSSETRDEFDNPLKSGSSAANRNNSNPLSPVNPARGHRPQGTQPTPDSGRGANEQSPPANPRASDQQLRPNADSDTANKQLDESETAKPPAGAAEAALQKLRELWNRQVEGESRSAKRNLKEDGVPSSAGGRVSSSSPLDSMQRPGSGQQPGSTQQRQPLAEPGSAPRSGSADVADGRARNESSDEWDRRIENLIRQQRGQPPLPAPSAGASSGVRPGADSGQRGSGSDTADIARPGTGKPSVAEFLEIMQGVTPSEPQTSSGRDAEPPSSGRATDAERREDLAEQLRRRQEDAKQDLQQLGLQETLKKIVRGAKKEAQQQQIAAQQNSQASQQQTDPETAATDGSGGMSESMLKALGGISRDLIEIVKDARLKSAEDQKRDGSGNAQTTQAAEPSATRSFLKGLQDTTTQLLADIDEPPAPRAAATADEEPAQQAVPASFTDLIVQWLLPVLLISILLIVFLWRSGVIAAPGFGAGTMLRVTEADLQSRADVVRAFHRMALQPARATQHWWTHQMVADDIREASPDKDEQVRILTRLYEQARYLPEDADFTPEQIREAQAALKRCET